jgi:uncharacterized RDD family membrane protein YckC
MTEGGFSPLPREARPYQLQRAGLVTRGVAAVIDGVVVAGVLLSGYAAWTVLLYLLDPRNFSFPDIGLVFSLATAFVVTVVYLGLAWRISGRSYGCLVMGLRVVNYRGGRMTLVGALLRALFCAIVPIGLLWVAVSRQNRSLQDSVLRTSVIYDWEPRAASSAATRARSRQHPSL